MQGAVKKASAAKSAAKHVVVVAEESMNSFFLFFFYALHRSLLPGDSSQLTLEKRSFEGKGKREKTRATVLPVMDKSDGY